LVKKPLNLNRKAPEMMQSEEAEVLAIRALGWLAADDELWPRFLGATGATQDGLAAAAADPAFLAAVLDFLTQDDATVIAFCDAADLAYDAPLQARRALPGGEEVSWT
jgi:hypothetical protein